MSRVINIVRRAYRPVASITFKQTVAPRPVLVLARSFSAAHGHGAHGSGKAEPFLDAKQVADRIIEVIKGFEKIQAQQGVNISASSKFKEDLNLDSLDAVEVVMAIEEEFSIEIPDSEADKILSVSDAVNYVSNHPMAK